MLESILRALHFGHRLKKSACSIYQVRPSPGRTFRGKNGSGVHLIGLFELDSCFVGNVAAPTGHEGLHAFFSVVDGLGVCVQARALA